VRQSLVMKIVLVFVVTTLLEIAAIVILSMPGPSSSAGSASECAAIKAGLALKAGIEIQPRSDTILATATLNAILQKAVALNMTSIAVYSDVGVPFFIVENNRQITKPIADPAVMTGIGNALAAARTTGVSIYQQPQTGQKPVTLYIPFTWGLNQTAVAVANTPPAKAARPPIVQIAVGGGIILLLQAIFFGALLTVLIIPLRKLISVTRSLAKAETIERVPIVRDDEIGELASAFNEVGILLQRMRDEARGAHPISGLPGGITIAKYIDECLTGGHMICTLSCDIDNFKAFNDKYGFAKGDEVILYTRDCLLAVAQRKELQGVFVGHLGGDDFMAVCRYEMWETFTKLFVTTFDRGIYQFYTKIDARNGYIESTNRAGQRQRFPLMSISIAAVTNKTRPFKRYAEMIHVAGEVMKYVKTIEGSGYAIDRRQGSITDAVVPPQMGIPPPPRT
jgi:diguanylate cyclase (GGDEF)-like protein